MKSNAVPPFDTRIFRTIHNYSKGNVEKREISDLGKLPLLHEEDGSENKYNAADGFSFSTGNHQAEHGLDALFLDTTPPFRSYEHKMQELAANESKISTDAIIRLGGERFIESYASTSNTEIISNGHPYASSFSGFSDQQVKDVQLIENLLLSAEKVTQQQYELSIKLLDWCDHLSCGSGNPIQRLVHYFSKALREKIDKEAGRVVSSSESGKKDVPNLAERVMSPNPIGTMLHEKSALYQVGHFAGVQALVDAVSGSKKVHVIDLSIKHGAQCTILMQALVSQHNCPIEHLKVTAVGTNSKQIIEQTGDCLKSFAESINLSFSFNLVIVEDMLDFNKDLLELDPDEALGVYTSYGLWTMIAQQDRLESLMKVIKSINPHVMVVCEVAANLNSPNFVNRFIEGLFFYGALFDSLEDCLGREDKIRTVTESMHFGKGINNVVASEGAERVIRHVNIHVWRKFFARFGMKETALSMSSLFQVNLAAEKFSCGRSCTFDRDGDSLIIGWKGTPIQCLSVWKFS